MKNDGKYRVRVETFFEAAHNLRSYKGVPEPLHGHSWKAEVEVETTGLDAEGMGVDFVELRDALSALTGRLHYTYINEVPPFTDIEPTAENIARWMYEDLGPKFESETVRIIEIRVFEGRHASGAFRPELSKR